MQILLKKLHMENFKKTKDQTIDFGHITKISGIPHIRRVKEGAFPAEEHTFKINDEVLDKLY